MPLDHKPAIDIYGYPIYKAAERLHERFFHDPFNYPWEQLRGGSVEYWCQMVLLVLDAINEYEGKSCQ